MRSRYSSLYERRGLDSSKVARKTPNTVPMAGGGMSEHAASVGRQQSHMGIAAREFRNTLITYRIFRTFGIDGFFLE